MTNLQTFVLMLAAVSLTAVTALAQHRYYARTVRRLAAAHPDADCVLVSGRGKSRLRGAIVVLVLRRDDERIRAATVMEGATVLARFTDRPDWVGLSARDPLPRCSTRAAAAVADARTRLPGRRSAPLPRSRFAPAPRGGRPVRSER
jgi:glucitol operon activator protein